MKASRLLVIAVLLLSVASIFSWVGCKTITTSSIDPNGVIVTTPKTVIDPNHPAVVTAEKGLEVGAGVATALSGIIPGGAAIAGILSGLLGAWIRLKPQVIQAQDKSQVATMAAKGLVMAIEELKTKDPNTWENTLKPRIAKIVGPATSVENFLRELRGLPLIE